MSTKANQTIDNILQTIEGNFTGPLPRSPGPDIRLLKGIRLSWGMNYLRQQLRNDGFDIDRVINWIASSGVVGCGYFHCPHEFKVVSDGDCGVRLFAAYKGTRVYCFGNLPDEHYKDWRLEHAELCYSLPFGSGELFVDAWPEQTDEGLEVTLMLPQEY
jgi:hypothetical protein